VRPGESLLPRWAVWALLGLAAASVWGQDAGGVRIRGRFLVSAEGTLYAFLVDPSTFKMPGKGVRSWTALIGPAEQAAGFIPFELVVPPGVYGVRCFIDRNGNGILDAGPLGPSEPWGMSRGEGRRRMFPRFPAIAFQAYRDIESLDIEVR